MILTLCVSGLALALSAVSLSWQVISWRRSGPRVKVIRIQSFAPHLVGIGIKAENSGRLATQIQQLGFQLPGGHYLTSPEDFLGRPIQLPIDLPPGGQASVTFNAHGIRNALADRRPFGKKVRPFVVTGHGRFDGPAIDLASEVDQLCRE